MQEEFGIQNQTVTAKDVRYENSIHYGLYSCIILLMENLAEFIQQKRESRGLSVSGLAELSGIQQGIIEDIESGRELFLSVPQRQKLARVLKCSPKEIRRYEREYEFEVIPDTVLEDLKAEILNKKTGLKCPVCGEPLITRIAEMYDLDDIKVLKPKAHCVKCVFQIK